MNDNFLSLTSKDSHIINTGPGVGSFTIGTKGISKGEFDAMVDEDSVINWDAFNGHYTPATSKQKDKYPYGTWPRFFAYSGNDMGFIKWSSKRHIEEFCWFPQKEIVADFTNADINILEIHSSKNIELSIGKNISYLALHDNLNNFKIKKCDKVPFLYFWPDCKDDTKTCSLPVYAQFKNAIEVQVNVDSGGSPFNCETLLQFPNLERLYLIGNMTNLSALNNLKNLKKIGLWDMKNLSGFPNLEVWNNLNSFIAVNIEENAGKKFRTEVKELKKLGRLKDFTSVCSLRSEAWFETNCGIPFSYWEGKNEKKAMSIYKKCLKKVNDAKNEDDIKAAIIEYTKKFNSLDDIETIEREDIYSALCKIMKNSPIEIKYEKWFSWFEENREF